MRAVRVILGINQFRKAMIRIKILLPVLLACILPFSVLHGQVKKSEKKIKVVVANKNCPQVVIDTTFSGNYSIDSIRLKDGSLIYLGKNSMDVASSPSSRRKEVYITAVADKKDNGEDRSITVICSDSLMVSETDDEEGTKKVIINKLRRDGKRGARSYMYIDEYENDLKNPEERDEELPFNDYYDKNTDRTKYVIAKKGIVITIEGDDEALVEDIRKEIENKLAGKPE
jgi:hypothetical protein